MIMKVHTYKIITLVYLQFEVLGCLPQQAESSQVLASHQNVVLK